jgi:hypothetical protein
VVRALANPQQHHADRRHLGRPCRCPTRTSGAQTTYGVLFANSGQQLDHQPAGLQSATGEQIARLSSSQPDGQSVIPYNAGTRYSPGQQLLVPLLHRRRRQSLQQPGFALFGRAETYSATGIGHYDLTDHMKLSGELLFAHTKGTRPAGHPDVGRRRSGFTVTNSNPYLTAALRSRP